MERLTYGDDPSQWADVRRPAGRSRGLVVVVHGGFWKAQYDAAYGDPLAADLAARGWTTANVEYRRVGSGPGGGGGFPGTFDDVAAAIDLVGAGHDVVVTLGHSAGGHLATWAAGRTRFDRWRGGVPVTHVVSQAGVLDLVAAARAGLGGGAVERLMDPLDLDDASYDLADPARHLPLDVPVWAVHARDDEDVPFEQSRAYVERATAAGATATLVEVAGGHFGMIDTTHPAWATVVGILDEVSPPSRVVEGQDSRERCASADTPIA